MRRHAVVFLAFLLCGPISVALVASPALALGEDRTVALDLFEQGRVLFKRGDFDAALAKFEAAAKVMRTFGILLNVAECQERLGRTASAWATWREAGAVASAAQKPDDEAMAIERQQALGPRLSRLTIVVPRDADLPELEIVRDGAILPREAWGSAIAVDPGMHSIETRAPGHRGRMLELTVGADAESPVVTVSALEKELPGDEHALTHRSNVRLPGWILGGVGIVAAGAGIAVAAYGQSQHDAAVSTDLAGHLPQAESEESTANTTKDAGYVAIGVGGAFLVSGAIMLLFAYSPSHVGVANGLRLRPWIARARGGGMAATW